MSMMSLRVVGTPLLMRYSSEISIDAGIFRAWRVTSSLITMFPAASVNSPCTLIVW